MNKIKLFFVCSLLFFFSCNLATNTNIAKTTIVAGTAQIAGRIILPENNKKDSITIPITILNSWMRLDVPEGKSVVKFQGYVMIG